MSSEYYMEPAILAGADDNELVYEQAIYFGSNIRSRNRDAGRGNRALPHLRLLRRETW